MANEAKITVKADASDVSGKLKKMRGSFLALGAAGAAVAGAIALSVTSFAKAGDEIQKMGLRTGFTTESLSELKFALEQSGSNIEGFEKGIRRMSSFIADGRDGLTETTRALDTLGIQVDDFTGKSPEDSFDILAQALAGVTDATMQSALAQDIFGRSGTALIPLLKQGEQGIAALRQEAHDLGIVFDQDAANAAARLVDAQNTLTKSIDGVKFAMAEGLAPAISGIAETLAVTVSKVSEFARENPLLTKTVVALALGLGGLAMAIAGIGLVLPLMATGLGLVTVGFIGLNLATGGLLLGIGLLVAGIVLLIKNWDAVVQAISVGVNFMLGAVELYVNGWIIGLNLIIEGINKLGAVFGLSIETIAEVELPRWQRAMKETEEVIEDSTDAIIEDNEETGESFKELADAAEASAERIISAKSEEVARFIEFSKKATDETNRRIGLDKLAADETLAIAVQEAVAIVAASDKRYADLKKLRGDDLADFFENIETKADGVQAIIDGNKAEFARIKGTVEALPSVIPSGGIGSAGAPGANAMRLFKDSQHAVTDALAAAQAQLAAGNFSGAQAAATAQAEVDRLLGITQGEAFKGGALGALIGASRGGFGGAPPMLPGTIGMGGTFNPSEIGGAQGQGNLITINFNGDVLDIDDAVARSFQNLTDQGFDVSTNGGREESFN